MSRISTQSIFQTSTTKPLWQSYAVSGVVHAIAVLLAFLLAVPVMRQIKANEHVTLIAPPLPEYKVKPQHISPPDRMFTRIILPAKPPDRIFGPPVPVERPAAAQTPKIVPAAPKIEAAVTPVPELKPDLPAVPKPLIKTGVFTQPTEVARATPAPQKAALGGFGDPNGVHPSDQSHPAPVMLAKVGSFDLPNGGGESGAGGKSQNGGVKQGGFGSFGDPSGAPAGTGNGGNGTVKTGGFGESNGIPVGSGGKLGGSVQSSGFGDSTQAVAPAQRREVPMAAPATPVEILFKPRPSYTAEAKNLHLEGEVSIEVVFTSSGSVRVLRVVRGLGHGLDEAAEQAALKVRFKPATRGGVPVDTNATINITFELT